MTEEKSQRKRGGQPIVGLKPTTERPHPRLYSKSLTRKQQAALEAAASLDGQCACGGCGQK